MDNDAEGWTQFAQATVGFGPGPCSARCWSSGRLTLLAAPFHHLFRRRYSPVYVSLSLLFCLPAFWERSWASLQRAVGIGGRLAVTLFGLNDDWANEPGMTFRTPDELRTTLPGFETEVLRKEEYTAALALGGSKYVHLVMLIARRGAPYLRFVSIRRAATAAPGPALPAR